MLTKAHLDELFYQKKSEWMLSCKNIYPVQSTSFNYPISTRIYIPINIPSKIPTLYVNTGNLFSQQRQDSLVRGTEPHK